MMAPVKAALVPNIEIQTLGANVSMDISITKEAVNNVQTIAKLASIFVQIV